MVSSTAATTDIYSKLHREKGTSDGIMRNRSDLYIVFALKSIRMAKIKIQLTHSTFHTFFIFPHLVIMKG